MNDDEFHYRYKWHAGEWGEKVQNYIAEIRVFDINTCGRCIMQWSSTFDYFEDAIRHYRQSLVLNPGFEQAHHQLNEALESIAKQNIQKCGKPAAPQVADLSAKFNDIQH